MKRGLGGEKRLSPSGKELVAESWLRLGLLTFLLGGALSLFFPGPSYFLLPSRT